MYEVGIPPFFSHYPHSKPILKLQSIFHHATSNSMLSCHDFPPFFLMKSHEKSTSTRGHQVPSNSARQVTWAQYQESTRARTEQDRFAAMTQDETRAMAGGWRKGTRWGMAIFFFFPELLSIWIYSDLMGFNGIL